MARGRPGNNQDQPETAKTNNGSGPGFEARLRATADTRRGNLLGRTIVEQAL